MTPERALPIAHAVMARRFSVTAVLSLVFCFLSGCFTIWTQDTGEPPGPRVFSGTRAHVMAMASGRVFWHHGEYWTLKAGLVPILIWFPLDLPLSFVADIVILPYTIPAQLMYGNFLTASARRALEGKKEAQRMEREAKEKEEEEAPATRSTDK